MRALWLVRGGVLLRGAVGSLLRDGLIFSRGAALRGLGLCPRLSPKQLRCGVLIIFCTKKHFVTYHVLVYLNTYLPLLAAHVPAQRGARDVCSKCSGVPLTH